MSRQKVDFVIGYISSGDCLAIPPVADELKTLTILMDCGTPRVLKKMIINMYLEQELTQLWMQLQGFVIF